MEIEGVDAAKIMATKHIKRLPLEDRHEIVGIVTARDVVEAFARSSLKSEPTGFASMKLA